MMSIGVAPIKHATKVYFSPFSIDFIKANSADPDEMLHSVAIHLDHYCLPKYPIGVSSIQRVKKPNVI